MSLARFAVAAGLALALAAPRPAPAEPAPWDGARAAALAKQLVDAVDDLYDVVFVQPQLVETPNAVRDYERLKRELRRMRNQARGLAADLERGETREQTQQAYESILVSVSYARERVRSLFTTQDVEQRAAQVRDLLDRLAPYYGTAAPKPTE